MKAAWRKWIAASRWSYNTAIAYLRDCWMSQAKRPTAFQLRKIVNDLAADWVKGTPYNPRGAAVLDAHDAFKKCEDKRDPRFRSCREQVQSIKLQSDNWTNNTTYPRQLGKAQINPSEPLCSEMPSDFSVVLDRGRWFICFAVPMQIEPSSLDNAIALDPGVRTFLTGFDGQSVTEFAPAGIGRIAALCQRLDRLQSQWTTLKGRSNKRHRWQLRQIASSIRIKVSNLIDDAHNRVAAYLTKRYKHIFLPTFETSQMIVKKKRNIRSKTARSMLSWSHYKFKQTLKFHAQKRGSVVHDVTEEYTSKTCSKCGHIHSKLGGSKKFVCPECGHTIDRDWNGAINILMKSLSALTSVEAGEDTPQYTVDFGTNCQILPG
ncbi:MAG: transposase [Nostocaceae cyanobacterium]|nr:transposase [Nostocaceae cyanobacterium]